MNIILKDPKDFKWLRLVLTALKNTQYTEQKPDFWKTINPSSVEDPNDRINHFHELHICKDEAMYIESDERRSHFHLHTRTWKRGSMSCEVTDEVIYKTKKDVEHAKAMFVKYLEDNPNMREWGKTVKNEYRCMES